MNKLTSIIFFIALNFSLSSYSQTVKVELANFESYSLAKELHAKIISQISKKFKLSDKKLVLLPTLYSDSTLLGIIHPTDLRYRYDSIGSRTPYNKIYFIAYNAKDYLFGAYYYGYDNEFIDIVIDKYAFSEMGNNGSNFPFTYNELELINTKEGKLFYCHLAQGVFYFLPEESNCIFRKIKNSIPTEIICK